MNDKPHHTTVIPQYHSRISEVRNNLAKSAPTHAQIIARLNESSLRIIQIVSNADKIYQNSIKEQRWNCPNFDTFHDHGYYLAITSMFNFIATKFNELWMMLTDHVNIIRSVGRGRKTTINERNVFLSSYNFSSMASSGILQQSYLGFFALQRDVRLKDFWNWFHRFCTKSWWSELKKVWLCVNGEMMPDELNIFNILGMQLTLHWSNLSAYLEICEKVINVPLARTNSMDTILSFLFFQLVVELAASIFILVPFPAWRCFVKKQRSRWGIQKRNSRS